MREPTRRLTEQAGVRAWLEEWRSHLVTRRRILLQLAGGTAAAILPWGVPGSAPAETAPPLDEKTRWQILDAVQQHLFPSEKEAPGAREIKALDYLRFIVADETQDAEERAFILQGAGWLEDMAHQMTQSSFLVLEEEDRERVLRRIETSTAGRNWLSLLLLYLFEALLADPAYGGNPGGIGWRWLAHIPGFPRPPRDKLYPELLKR